MKPFSISCPCNAILHSFVVLYTPDQKLVLYGLCPNCLRTIVYEITIEALITKCATLPKVVITAVAEQPTDEDFLRQSGIEPGLHLPPGDSTGN